VFFLSLATFVVQLLRRENMQESNLELLERFNAAFNRQDADGMMACMSVDCVFENTYPSPEGERYSGWPDVRIFWVEFFQRSPSARLDFEEIVVMGERGFQRWIYSWQDESGGHGHVRGVDVLHFQDGLIVEKLSYVKG
jgi:ketosteroid isomerase-like protein